MREWLGAMATAGIVEYDHRQPPVWLPREHAVCLTGSSPENMSGLALLTTILAEHVAGVTDAFRTGGGVPYDAFAPDIHDALDALWGPIYSQLLVPEYLPLVPRSSRAAGRRCPSRRRGLRDRPRARGARQQRFPRPGSSATTSTARPWTEARRHRDRAEAHQRHLREGRRGRAARRASPSTSCSCSTPSTTRPAPDAALSSIHDALVPGGIFVMDEPRVSSRLEDNLDNPMAPFTYAVSTLHCLTVSLAVGGAGLGTAWGEQLAVEMLHDAGFGRVDRPRRARRSRQRRLRHHP